ncbi:zinc finger BED domain-containing protein RICESLEEPER 2-like protein [Tanacetum coccineum]
MIICDKKIVRIPLDDETLTIRSNRSDGYASIQNIDSFQETARDESPIEFTTSPSKTKKPTRGRQKRAIQSDDAPRQIAWTHEEEIALCKCWADVSENSSLGNTRKDAGFWCEVLQYMESKTNSAVVEHTIWLREIGASDEDYYARALVDYEAEIGTTFKLRHCWKILKGSPKWMQSEVPKFAAKFRGGSKRYKSSQSSSFNTEFEKASINLNANVSDDEEDEVKEIRRPMGRDKAKNAAKKK